MFHLSSEWSEQYGNKWGCAADQGPLACYAHLSPIQKFLPQDATILQLCTWTHRPEGWSVAAKEHHSTHLPESTRKYISPFKAKCSGWLPGAKLRDVSTDEYSLSIFDTLADGEVYFVIEERRGIWLSWTVCFYRHDSLQILLIQAKSFSQKTTTQSTLLEMYLLTGEQKITSITKLEACVGRA